MPAGRPRKPTAELKLHGSFNKTIHGDRCDDALAHGMPQKPQGMSPQEEWLWDLVVSSLPMESLSTLDTAALVGMCWWWGEWRRWTVAMEDGDVDPYKCSCMAGAAWKHFEKGASKFGMTPVDRTRLVVPQASGKDELEAFLEEA